MQTMFSAPERSLAQRFEALDRANRIRFYRAGLKRELAAGQRSVIDVLLNPDPQLDTMKVVELLLAVPKVGRVKISKWFNRARISPTKTLGGLTTRQRRELAAMIGASVARGVIRG